MTISKSKQMHLFMSIGDILCLCKSIMPAGQLFHEEMTYSHHHHPPIVGQIIITEILIQTHIPTPPLQGRGVITLVSVQIYLSCPLVQNRGIITGVSVNVYLLHIQKSGLFSTMALVAWNPLGASGFYLEPYKKKSSDTSKPLQKYDFGSTFCAYSLKYMMHILT